MKRYALNGLKEITAVETTSGNYYLASDVDDRDKRIREEAREREGFYEKLWKDFCSLQRGSAQGVVARVEQYYRDHPEGALSAPAVHDALRDTFVAGAVAGGSMARQLSRTDTWQEWLNGEIERRYPKAALAPRGEGGNCICESQLGEKGEHFPMCPNYSKPAPAAPDALREEVIALTKWRDIWQGEIGNDDDWFIQGIEYASGKILKILSGDSGQRELLESARHALRSYENGNRATGLARRVADRIDAFFAPRKEDEG